MALIVRMQAAGVAARVHSAISAQEEWPIWKPAAAAPVSAVAAVAAAPGSAVAAVVVGQAAEGAVLVAVAVAAADVDPICD